MSDPIQQSMEQVIEHYLSSPPAKRAQVCLCLYALHPLLAAELHHLSILHIFETDPQAAKQPQGSTPQASLDVLLRHHASTTQL